MATSRNTRKSLYTIRAADSSAANTLWHILKFSTEGEHLETYHLSRGVNDRSFVCTCWAGHKWCRHKQMMQEFLKNQRIDTGWMYQFDTGEWIPPTSPEEV